MGLAEEIKNWFGDDFTSFYQELVLADDKEREALRLLLEAQQTLAQLKTAALQETTLTSVAEQLVGRFADEMDQAEPPPWQDPDLN